MVETSEEAPSGPPVDVRLSPVDQHTLLVSWKPPLKDHWNGDILGYYVGYKKTVIGSDKPYMFETVEFIKVNRMFIILWSNHGEVIAAFTWLIIRYGT